jgi:hypothetical protein
MKLSIEDIFKYSYCLTVDDDSYQYLCGVFKYFKLPIPKKHRGIINNEKGPTCCYIGHLSLVMMARTLDLPYITIFEDDAYPCIDIINGLNFHLEDIPDDCGILSYGHSSRKGWITDCGKYCIFNEKPTGAHAYTVFKSAYDDFIASLEKEEISDRAMKGINFKDSKIKPYWTYRCLFIQRTIHTKRMSCKVKGSFTYVYPGNDGCAAFTNEPPEGWLHIPGEQLSIKESLDYSFEINLQKNIIYRDNGDTGKLTHIEANKWMVTWEASGTTDYLYLNIV